MKLIYKLDGRLAASTEKGLMITTKTLIMSDVFIGTYKSLTGEQWSVCGDSDIAIVSDFLDGNFTIYEPIEVDNWQHIQNCLVIDENGEELEMKENKLYYKGKTYSFHYRPRGNIGVDSECPSYLKEHIITNINVVI